LAASLAGSKLLGICIICTVYAYGNLAASLLLTGPNKTKLTGPPPQPNTSKKARTGGSG
jgi:hypothetical protein